MACSSATWWRTARPPARASPRATLIAAAAGRPIRDPDDLFDALHAAQGATIELTVIRGADERTIQVTFA